MTRLLGDGAVGEPGKGIRLLGRSALHPTLLSLARAHTGSARLGYPAPGGAGWLEAVANQAVFQGPPERLRIGAGPVNNLRNPRGEGLTPGTLGAGGALPTNWARPNSVAGISIQVLGRFTVNGVDTVRLRYTGTAASSTFDIVEFEQRTQITAAPSQVWAASMLVRLVSGSLSALTTRVRIFGLTSGGVAVAGNALSGSNLSGTLGSSWTRSAVVATLTSDVTLARVVAGLNFDILSGTVVDFTVDIGWPQLEQAGVASLPALPPPGAPGVAAVGPDLVTASLAALGIPANGLGTYLFSGVIPQAAPAAASQTLFQLDDGTDSNRFVLRNEAGGNEIRAMRVLAGAGANAAAGNMVANTPFRAAVSVNSAGRIAGSLNGGAAVAVTGGPTGGLTTLRVGGMVSAGVAPLGGDVGGFWILPYVTADADLPGLCNLIPF